ncbi:hypothetical protein VSU01S_07570 [Vibrio superstes NBRC 103154]|uniref:Bacteriophage T5 Orf172 DNA-binding domain-containing protein n=1 Tax=Vibrio superstes NBRC 103154 TaxID=1219062 RepID=A0A511QPN7_9VIBR|nr:hypothetical protein VSU01S_07570 [Vibrio superstes NBRC 103154]
MSALEYTVESIAISKQVIMGLFKRTFQSIIRAELNHFFRERRKRKAFHQHESQPQVMQYTFEQLTSRADPLADANHHHWGQGQSQRAQMNEWVYILSNPAMPGLIKIGMTTRSVEERVRELNRSTSAPASFTIERKFRCRDGLAMEKRLHRKYDHLRFNDKREFFMMSPHEVDPR